MSPHNVVLLGILGLQQNHDDLVILHGAEQLSLGRQGLDRRPISNVRVSQAYRAPSRGRKREREEREEEEKRNARRHGFEGKRLHRILVALAEVFDRRAGVVAVVLRKHIAVPYESAIRQAATRGSGDSFT